MCNPVMLNCVWKISIDLCTHAQINWISAHLLNRTLCHLVAELSDQFKDQMHQLVDLCFRQKTAQLARPADQERLQTLGLGHDNAEAGLYL